MAKSTTQRVDLDDSAVKAIFIALLQDFRERGLGANDLQQGYEGPTPDDLKTQCCVSDNFGEVDFDLAFKSLRSANLVKTGPMRMIDNIPGSGVLFLGARSENKYTFLTETGYQQGNRIRADRPRRSNAPNVHISGGTFHNSPIGVGHTVSQTLNLNTATTDQLIERLREEIKSEIVDEGRQQEILEKLEALQTADKPSRMERYIQVMGAIGDHITVLSFLLTPLLHSLQG